MWSFVAWVVTSTNINVYLMNSNGVSSAALVYPNPVEAFDWVSTIGSDSFTNSRTFEGSISEVSIFNQALTENQLVGLFVAGSDETFPPQITLEPLSPTIYAGRNAQFNAGVASAAPFTYGWMTTNGSGGFLPLSSGSGPVGTNLLTQLVNNVSASTPSQYEVAVTNIFGSVTSSVASLTVVSPGAISTYEKAVASNQPVAFWRLDETNINPATGTAPAYDYYGGFTGVYGVNACNGATPSPNAVSGPTFSGFETAQGALETFADTTNSNVTVPSLYLNTSTMTCSLWMHPANNEGQDAALFFCRGGTTVSGFGYGNIIANELGYAWDNAPASFNWVSGLSAPVGVWSLVSWVLTPTNLTIYVMNSTGVTSANYSNPNPFQAFNAPSTIGVDTYSDTRTFNGMISNVTLFNQALTQTQLAGLYSASGGGSAPTYSPVTLQISIAGTNVTLSWPASAGPYFLQANTNLTAAGWANVTNSTNTVNGTNQVVTSFTNHAQFYRLSSQ